MKVACEHCNAEYDVDQSEITGRGVRITCPSCSHVFIVYQSTEPASDSSFELDIDIELDEDGELSMDLDAMLSSMMDDDQEEKEVDSVVQKETDIPQGKTELSDAKDVLLDGVSEANQTPVTTSNVQIPVESEKPSLVVEEDVVQAVTDEEVAELDVNSLNFASVGIKSWKVKKSIGLMFEYSDFKTFKKSLNDGRISNDDTISPDGKNWIPMSDVSDFELYFCRTYLEFEKLGVTTEKKVLKERVIQPLGGTNELASALAAAQAEVEQANTAPARTRPKSKPARKSRPKQTAPVKSESSSGLVVNILIGVALIGGGWYFFGGGSTPSEQPEDPSAGVKQIVQQPRPQEDDAALKALRDELQRNAAIIEAQQEPEPEPSTEEEPQLIAKVPDEILAQQRAMQEGANTVLPKKQTKDPAEEGAKALNAQQWDKAIVSFNNAYQATSNPEYLSSVGFAQYKLNDFSNAKKTLKAADGKGAVSAKKWLGYILRDEGDIAGSNQYLNQYLQSNPSDAAEVKRRMLQ